MAEDDDCAVAMDARKAQGSGHSAHKLTSVGATRASAASGEGASSASSAQRCDVRQVDTVTWANGGGGREREGAGRGHTWFDTRGKGVEGDLRGVAFEVRNVEGEDRNARGAQHGPHARLRVARGNRARVVEVKPRVDVRPAADIGGPGDKRVSRECGAKRGWGDVVGRGAGY